MEAFSALSLASAVIQFVDFGASLLGESHEIHQSAVGASKDHVAMEEIYENLSRLIDKLAVSSQMIGYECSKEDEALAVLATSCRGVAHEFLAIVQKLKVQGDSHRKWKSFLQALRTVWKKQDIKTLRKRLDGFSSQLTVQLAAIIR